MKKTINGFTIVELTIIIVVIGILTAFGVMNFTNIQTDVRDSQRSSRVKIISEALEKYYEKNGEYPACSALDGSTKTPQAIASSVLNGIDPSVFATPTDEKGANSIVCEDITSTTDKFAYNIDCNNQFSIKYRSEADGELVTIKGKRGSLLAEGGVVSEQNGVKTHTFDQPGGPYKFTTYMTKVLTINIYGAGGGAGSLYNINQGFPPGLPGGSTIMTIGSNTLTAYGGGGGDSIDIFDGHGNSGTPGNISTPLPTGFVGTAGGANNGGAGIHDGPDWAGDGGGGGRITGTMNGPLLNATINIGAGGAGDNGGGAGYPGGNGGNGRVTISYLIACS